MTLEKHLEMLSIDNSRNLLLYQTWGILKNVFSQKLESVCLYFPHFSLHNSTHSETICMQIEKFLGEDRINKLSPTDTWMLLSAFYGHDLGMAIEFDEVENLFQKEEFKEELQKLSLQNNEIACVAKRLLHSSTPASPDFISNYKDSLDKYKDIQIIIENSFRDSHAKRSGNYIKSHPELFPNISERFVNILADICEMHQQQINSLMNLPYKSNGISNDYMHPRLVASLLCLGDLLDLDNDRFNEFILKSATPLPQNSYLHLLKHKSIQHFLVEPEGIEIKSDTDDIEVYRLMRNWCSWIEGTCEFLLLHWNQIAPLDWGIAPILRKKELLLNHSTKWLDYSDLRFTISDKRAIELLKGADIYKNKFVCIREIIQNAVDATLVQVWKDITERDPHKYNSNLEPSDIVDIDFPHYSINISISINANDKVEICIRDKGTGISIKEVERISKIGNTMKSTREKTIEEMPPWFRPSGAFGLGLQSIFLLTDKFEIITKTEDEPAKRIIMESGSSGKGYILVDDYNSSFSRGTKICFEVDPSKITINDLYCSEYHYKTEPISNLIITAINSNYNNLYKAAAPATLAQRQKADYIPVEVKCYNPYSHIDINILVYNSVFSEPQIYNNYGLYEENGSAISFKYYEKQTMTICSITIAGIEIAENCYGNYEHTLRDLNGCIFFKNVFVRSHINERYREEQEAIYREIDFSINFLGNDAEKMLTISRNGIKKDFNYDFKKLCDNSIQNSVLKLIDLVIEKDLTYTHILIKVYQLALFYKYRVEEFFAKYKGKLESCSFNNYYDIEGNEITKEFSDLIDQPIYFLADSIDEIVFSTIAENKVIDLNAKHNRVFLLRVKNKKPFQKPHILNHMLIKVFLAKFSGKYYRCIEALPFKSTNPYINYEKDDITILTDFLIAIYYDYRCMRANEKYNSITTPIKTQLGFDSLHQGNQMVIELPIDDQLREIIKSFIINTDVVFDTKQLLQNILQSSIFNSNVEYISQYNKEKVEVVFDIYKKWISDLINLLTDNSLKLYISYLAGLLEEHSIRDEWVQDTMENNYYITFSM